MPRISSFYGIVIAMYHQEHGVPHFHAYYGEFEASIAIDSTELLAGVLPARALRLIRKWAALHKESSLRTGKERNKRRLWKTLPRFPSIVCMEQLVPVTEVQCPGGHRLRLRFKDGASGELDFSHEEWRGVFAPLADPDYFQRVELDEELGTIVWPNGADIAPETLYRWVTEQPETVRS